MGKAAFVGPLLVSALGFTAASLGCGGKAVMDGSPGTGAGGAGAGGGSTTTTSTTTGSGGADCNALLATVQATLAEATACNSCSNTEQCYGGPLIYDTCGCQVGANSTTPDKANAATAAYNAWTSAGCGPYECGTICFSPGTPWFCTPTSGSGCTGVCSAGVY